MKRIYLDYAAGEDNPSSLHQEGVAAAKILTAARKGAAQFFAARPEEIIFTSGGTESNNLAVLGVARAYQEKFKKPGHIIVSAIEHKSILAPAAELAKSGWRIDYLPVDENGLIKLAELKKLLRPDTALVSIVLANNEIGTIEPIADVAKVIRHYREQNKTTYPYLHTDACQATAYLDLNVAKLGVDLLTISGRKIPALTAPQRNIGLLFIKKGTALQPILFGGGQEFGLRPGTENVSAIGTLAKALARCARSRQRESARLAKLRDYFISEIRKKIPTAKLNGSEQSRLPNNINFSFPGQDGEQLVLRLDARGIAAATGSACTAKLDSGSHVLRALGRSEAEASNAIRFSLGPETTKKDIDYVVRTLLQLAV